MEKPNIVDLKSIKLELDPGDYFWCSCGYSQNQPFCDGSHQGKNFEPVKFTVTEKKRVGYCLCKYSHAHELCDGTHKDLKI